MEGEEEDDHFFNDPELHAQLDQVENQFIINSQLNHSNSTSNRNSPQPAAKKIKLDHSNDPRDNRQNQDRTQQPHQESIQSLKHHIHQIQHALNQSNAEKTRLRGEVSVIRSKLDTHQAHTTKQIQDLKQNEIQLRLQAQQAEKELVRLKNQKDLRDTFKGLEESSKKQPGLLPQPTASNPATSSNPLLDHHHPSPKFRRQQNLFLNHHRQQKALNQPLNQIDLNKTKSWNPSSDFNFLNQSGSQQQPLPSSSVSPTKFVRSTPQDVQQPTLENSPSFIHPNPSSPLYPSPYSNTLHHLNRLNSQIDNLQINPPAPNDPTSLEPNKLINLIIIQLFQSFIVSISHDRGREINPTSILHQILNIPNGEKEGTRSTDQRINKRLEKLILELFICLSQSLDQEEPKQNTLDPSDKKNKKFKHLASSFRIHSQQHYPVEDGSTDDNLLDPQELFVLAFVAQLASIFVQITHLLSQTDLPEAQSHSIQILNILAQSSPLFTSYFLNHPDFARCQDLNQHKSLLNSPVTSNVNPSVLTVLIDYFNQVITFFDQLPQANQNNSSACGKEDHMFFIHSACLDFLQSICWDPPEVCYPTLADFLKSDQVLKFLLIENQPEMNLEKSLNILISLASRAEFSKVILTSQIRDVVSRNPTPSESNPNNLQNQSIIRPSNHKSSAVKSKTVVEEQQADESKEVIQVSVIERLIKILVLTLGHQINRYQYPRSRQPSYGENTQSCCASLNQDYHEIKVKTLSLLNLLAIKNPVVHSHQLSSSLVNDRVLNGFQFISLSCKFLFSILIKLIFLDSYLLWNLDGSTFHKLQIPKYIERIELAIEIFHKAVFSSNNNKSNKSSPSGTVGETTSMDLMNRLKEESCMKIIDSSSSSSSASIMMVNNSNNNLYHEFIICFSKLCFSTTTTGTSHNARLALLTHDLVLRLDYIGDLAYELLQSVASLDELEGWKLASIDEDECEDDDNDDH